MIRSLVGFAIFAVIAIFLLKLLFGLLGLFFGLLASVLWLALIGFVVYLILKVVAPGTAARVREAVTGKTV